MEDSKIQENKRPRVDSRSVSKERVSARKSGGKNRRSRSNEDRSRRRNRRSRSRSYSKDRKGRTKNHRSRSRSERRRSRSRDRKRRDNSRDRHRGDRDRRRSRSEDRSKRKMPFQIGQIFKGKIVKVQDFGFFVLIEDPETKYKKEGLVHVSQIRQG